MKGKVGFEVVGKVGKVVVKLGKENLLFLSWLPTDDGVEHRNVLKSKLLPFPPDLSKLTIFTERE